MQQYSVELTTRKYVKGYGISSFAKTIKKSYWIQD